MERSDLELVNDFLARRDERAFEVMYSRYANPVQYAMTRALGGFCSSEVDELTQDFWARLPELLPAWEPERGSLRTYLVVQASWSARSAEAKRRRRRASRRADQVPAQGQDPGASRCMSAWSLNNSEGPEAALDSTGQRKRRVSSAIERYLGACTDRPAQVLSAWLDGRSGRDIAKDLGLHPAQISRDLDRARRRLSVELPALMEGSGGMFAPAPAL